jgi:hypothetical protein
MMQIHAHDISTIFFSNGQMSSILTNPWSPRKLILEKHMAYPWEKANMQGSPTKSQICPSVWWHCLLCLRGFMRHKTTPCEGMKTSLKLSPLKC